MAEGVIEYISDDILLYGFLAQLLAAVLSVYFVPTVRKLALAKKITDSPSARKSHTAEVPVLGGVAVYLAAAFSMFVIAFVFPSKIENLHFTFCRYFGLVFNAKSFSFNDLYQFR